MRLVVLGVACAIAASARAQERRPVPPQLVQAMRMAIAISTYPDSHDGALPQDLGVLLGSFTDADAVRTHFLPVGGKVDDIPAEPDAAWLAEHGVFGYLGGGGIQAKDVPDWGGTVIAHFKPEQTVEGVPDGVLTVPLLFLDGHVDMALPEDAARRIAESTAILDAIRTGGPFPEALQSEWNLRTIAAAIRGYAAAHDGMLPPDLGATLAYLPEDAKRLATAQQRARVYLAPRDAGRTAIPDNPTAEWVNRNTSYTYLGSGEIRMADVEDPQHTVLVHAELRDGVGVMRPGGVQKRLFTFATLGRAVNEEEEYAAWIVRQSEDFFAAARAHEPLPDYYADCRDVRLLARAVFAYAGANGDALPPDLGAVLPFVSASDGTPLAGRELAAVFVSARGEHAGALPDEPTAEWVARRGSYAYFGQGKTLTEFRRSSVVLVHAPLGETYHIRVPNAEIDAVAFADSRGYVTTVPTSFIQEMFEAKDGR